MESIFTYIEEAPLTPDDLTDNYKLEYYISKIEKKVMEDYIANNTSNPQWIKAIELLVILSVALDQTMDYSIIIHGNGDTMDAEAGEEEVVYNTVNDETGEGGEEAETGEGGEPEETGDGTGRDIVLPSHETEDEGEGGDGSKIDSDVFFKNELAYDPRYHIPSYMYRDSYGDQEDLAIALIDDLYKKINENSLDFLLKLNNFTSTLFNNPLGLPLGHVLFYFIIHSHFSSLYNYGHGITNEKIVENVSNLEIEAVDGDETDDEIDSHNDDVLSTQHVNLFHHPPISIGSSLYVENIYKMFIERYLTEDVLQDVYRIFINLDNPIVRQKKIKRSLSNNNAIKRIKNKNGGKKSFKNKNKNCAKRTKKCRKTKRYVKKKNESHKSPRQTKK